MSALARCLIICFLGMAMSANVRADASPEQAKEARVLFERGLAEADAAHWSQAAELFERALALRDSPVIRFNLSSALAELGRLHEALTLLRALEGDSRTSAELAARAVRDREAIERRLARLTIHVKTDARDYRVLLDERPLANWELEGTLTLDPKLHYVSLRVGERVLDDQQVELHDGETRELLLQGELPKPVTVPLQLSVMGSKPDVHDDTSKRKRRILWGISVATAAVAAGVVAGVMLARSKDDGGGAPADAFSPGRVGVRVPQ